MVVNKHKLSVNIGIEFELTIYDPKSKKPLPADHISDIRDLLESVLPQYTYTIEMPSGRAPARLEFKTTGTVNNIQYILDMFDKVTEFIYRIGFIIPPASLSRIGSMHVTLDIDNICIDNICEKYIMPAPVFFHGITGAEYLLIGAVGTPSRHHLGSHRVATYPSIKPRDIAIYYIVHVYIDEEDGSLNFMVLEEPGIVVFAYNSMEINNFPRGDIGFRSKFLEGIIIFPEKVIYDSNKPSILNIYNFEGHVNAIEYRFPELVERKYLHDYLSAILLAHIYYFLLFYSSSYVVTKPTAEAFPIDIYEIIKRSEKLFEVAEGKYDVYHLSDKAYKFFSRLYDVLDEEYDLSDINIIKPRKELFERNINIRKKYRYGL